MTAILKIGGGAGIDTRATLENLATRIHMGEQWVLVHGASDAANRLGDQLGYPAQTLITPDGHSSRYTDERTLDIFCAAVGSVNQQLTADLIGLGIRAVALSGLSVLQAKRKTAIRALRNGRTVIIRDDFTGTITDVDGFLLKTILSKGYLPVISPVAIGENGERLNVDGDLAAAHIARSLEADTLMILSNIPGLLRDVQNPEALIPSFDLADTDQFEIYAQGRMKKKLIAAQVAQAAQTIVADARCDNPLDRALAGTGTHIMMGAYDVAIPG